MLDFGGRFPRDFAADVRLGFPLRHDVEVLALVALLDDDVVRGEGDEKDGVDELVQQALVQVLEQDVVADVGDDGHFLGISLGERGGAGGPVSPDARPCEFGAAAGASFGRRRAGTSIAPTTCMKPPSLIICCISHHHCVAA